MPSESLLDTGEAHHCQSIFSAMFSSDCNGLSHLANVPVRFGQFNKVIHTHSFASSNHDIPAAANHFLNFNWAINSFSGGHFLSTISSRNLPFHVTLTCDQYKYGKALFCKFAMNALVLGSSAELLHHICSSGEIGQIHGYLIHSLNFGDSETTSKFWQLQATIIAQLRSLQNLQVIVAVIIPDHDGKCLHSFRRTLQNTGWILLAYDGVSFAGMGDSVAGTCDLLLGVHSSCMPTVDQIKLKPPPPVRSQPIGQYLCVGAI